MDDGLSVEQGLHGFVHDGRAFIVQRSRGVGGEVLRGCQPDRCVLPAEI